MKLFLAFVRAAAVLVVSFASYVNAVKPILGEDFAAEFARDVEGQQPEMSKRQHRNLSILTNQRWKDRSGDLVIVPIRISSAFSSANRALIESSIKSLADKSEVVQFVPQTNQRAYIYVKNDGKTCFSSVGRVGSGSSQVLNLGRGCLSTGTIQHEFLHALGFYHEQSRPDRDQYVTINLANVPAKNRHNFDIATGTAVLGAPYDYGSVMHYSETAFAINRNVNTITTKNGADIGQQAGASTQDIIEVRLLYQCLSGPRTLSSYNANRCTSDCKCWEGASGCNGIDTACRGDLKCENNVCVTGDGGSTGGSTGGGCSDVPSGWADSDGDSCQDYADNEWCAEYGDGYANNGKTANEACCTCGGGSNNGAVFRELRNTRDPTLCMDVKRGSTTDGTTIWHYPCNGSSAQLWFWDANNYLRSALDLNKCLVGSRGLTDQGTNLIINTCFADDDRFKWDYYTDSTIRPRNNNRQCIGPSLSELIGDTYLIHLYDCFVAPRQEWKGYAPASSDMSLRVRDDTCADSPPGWYDQFNDNCEWYAEDSNCEEFGSGAPNFDKTANQACCACGGGSTADTDDTADFPPVENEGTCWDTFTSWVDSVGDGCAWYSQGDNCQYYGGQFADSTGLTAQDVCCTCGGGSPTAVIDVPNQDSPGCSDSPSRWVDENNDGCAWYALADNCQQFGNDFANYGKTANEACCACQGLATTAAPVAAPVAAPTASPTMEPEEERLICFSGANTVEVQGKGVVSMTSLEIGDYVKSGEGQFSRVYSFGHIEREAQGTYYQITTEGLSTPLEISGPHIVYANGKAVRASDVSVGDMLGEYQVSKIELVRSMGVYAPTTESGDIIVSGVVASSYVALWDYSIVAQKMVYHAALAPLRVTCALNFDFCKTESYTAGGISSYFQEIVHAMSFVKEFGVSAQIAATLIVSPAIAAVYAAEQMLLSPTLMASVVGGVFVYTNSRKPVKTL